jgi:hypothetical protein
MRATEFVELEQGRSSGRRAGRPESAAAAGFRKFSASSDASTITDKVAHALSMSLPHQETLANIKRSDPS